MERVRHIGVITDAEDHQVPQVAKQIIDDLLFKIKYMEEENRRLTERVYSVIAQHNKGDRQRMEEDSLNTEESRPPKRTNRYLYASPLRQSPASSTSLSLDFDRLMMSSRDHAPHRTEDVEMSPAMREEPTTTTTTTTTAPSHLRVEPARELPSMRVETTTTPSEPRRETSKPAKAPRPETLEHRPSGRLVADPTVRLNPQSQRPPATATAPTAEEPYDDGLMSSDSSDSESYSRKKKKKCTKPQH